MSRDSAINPLHMSAKFIKAGEYESIQDYMYRLSEGEVG